nr:hypothetical protein [Gordonia sp. YC-JH1]
MLHAVEEPPLRAGRGEFAETGLDGTHRDPESGDRIDHRVVAEIPELLCGEQFRLAELGHVRQQRRVDRRAETLELGGGGQGLGEDEVGSGVDVRLRSVDRRIEALDAAGVGAGAHDEVLVAAGSDRGSQPAQHVVDRDHLLAVEVSAAFGVHLVLEVAAGQPGVLERRDGPGRTHRLAEPGVGVDERRQVGGSRGRSAARGDLGEGGEADVGQPQVGGQRGARDVHALESGVGHHLGHQR